MKPNPEGFGRVGVELEKARLEFTASTKRTPKGLEGPGCPSGRHGETAAGVASTKRTPKGLEGLQSRPRIRRPSETFQASPRRVWKASASRWPDHGIRSASDEAKTPKGLEGCMVTWPVD